MTRYITLAEYFWLAEQVTGTQAAVLIKASRVDLADSALHAPAAGFGEEEFYPGLVERPRCSRAGSPGTIRYRMATRELPGHRSSCSST